MSRLGGVSTVVVATATAACGLPMLSGLGPTRAAAGDEAISEPPAVVVDSTEPDTTEAATNEPVQSAPSTTPTTPPIPLSVAPASITVGVGGTARISGECPVVDGTPLGPVEISQIGSTVTPISTGVTAATWSYDWTAPAQVEPLVLQIWCGDPSQYQGGYPESLQIEVVFVAQEAPTTTSTSVPAPPPDVIPETG